MACSRCAVATLLAVAALLILARPGRAQNLIFIDAGTTGSVGSLAIVQDPASPSNILAGSSNGSVAFPVTTSLTSLAVTQSGAGNTMVGSVAGTRNALVVTTGMISGGGSNLLTTAAGSSGAQVQYAVFSEATTTASTVTATLNSVTGGVYVQQGATGAVDLTVNGGGYTLGHLATMPNPGATTAPPGVPAGFYTGGNPGVAVYQSGNGGITAVVTATAGGYTAAITNASASSGSYIASQVVNATTR
jgi:hypothetical protein